MHFLTRTFSCSKRGGPILGTSSTLPPPAMAAVTDRVAAQSPQPLGVAVGKTWVGGGSRQLAEEIMAGGATPCFLPHAEVCTPPRAATVAKTTAGDGHPQESGDGGGRVGREREGLHAA